jgi:hypothetical protein
MTWFWFTNHTSDSRMNSEWQMTHERYEWMRRLSLSLMLRPTVSRPVCLGIKHPSGAYDQIFITVWPVDLLMWCALSDERTGLPFTVAAGSCQCSHFRVRVPWGLVTIFYCLRFETSLFVASYDSQGYGRSILPRLHTSLSSRPHIYSLTVTFENVCCLSVDTETFVLYRVCL